MRCICTLAALALFPLGPAAPAAAATLLFDDFSGSTGSGVISGTNGVSFTSTTAVFGSPHDGIEYDSSFFPTSGVLEARIRVDNIGDIGAIRHDFGAIFDSAGADDRVAGDIFLVVMDSGLVQFTIAPIGNVDPFEQVQVVSQSSILDGSYHVVGIRYGSDGIELRIDGVVEDSDSFTGLRVNNRPVAVGDFTDRAYWAPDDEYAFSFIGEVDWIRSGDSFSVIPEPTTALLLACGLAGIAAAGRRRRQRSGGLATFSRTFAQPSNSLGGAAREP